VAGLQTEFNFTLPKGYVDGEGRLHRAGTMRLATARDEIEPLRDPRVTGPDDPYLTVLVLSRVITELGTLHSVSAGDMENLFAADLAFLQDLYGIINFGSADEIAALQRAAGVEPEAPAPVRVEPAPVEVALVEPVEVEPAPVKAAPVKAAPASATAPTRAAESPAVSRRRAQIEEVPRPTGT
jgi:hypothetical protein